MRVRDFLECANSDVEIKYSEGSVTVSAELLGDDMEYILTKNLLNRYVYSVEIKDGRFVVVLTYEEA